MKTQHIGLTTTIMAAMAISALHFVGFDGKVATAGSKAVGVKRTVMRVKPAL